MVALVEGRPGFLIPGLMDPVREYGEGGEMKRLADASPNTLAIGATLTVTAAARHCRRHIACICSSFASTNQTAAFRSPAACHDPAAQTLSVRITPVRPKCSLPVLVGNAKRRWR